MTLKNRRSYLDMLRIIACFLVIFNHLRGYSAYQQTTDSIHAFYYMGYTMFTRINVPIFFMISGSLLLSKDIGYKELLCKRTVRIVMALVCASMVAYLVNIRHVISSFDLVDFLRNLFNGKHVNAYWYLYAYIGFLLMVPMFRRIAKQLCRADFLLLLAVHFFFFTLLPLGNYVLKRFGISEVAISGDLSFPLVGTKALFYPLIGYYIDQVFDISKLNRKNVWILPVIILVGIVISSGFTYHQGIHYQYTQGFVQTFDYTTAIAVFLLVKYLFVNVKPIRNCSILHRIVAFVGSLTFGIYLIDPVLKVFSNRFNAVVTTQDPILYSIIWCVFSMMVGGFTTYLLKKIPVVKTLL